MKILAFRVVDAIILIWAYRTCNSMKASVGSRFALTHRLICAWINQAENSGRSGEYITGKELADMIYLYGEERHSCRVASAIIKNVDEKK